MPEEDMSKEVEVFGMKGIKTGEPKEALSSLPRPESEFFAGKLSSEMKPIAGGAPWLYDRKEDLDKISNPEARNKIAVLETTSGSESAREFIRKTYLELLGLASDGDVPLGEIQDQLIKINVKLEELGGKKEVSDRESGRGLETEAGTRGKGEKKPLGFSMLPELPENDPEGQREIMITALNKIEATNFPLDEANVALVTEIEASLYKLDEPELAAECMARIKLHDCFTLVNTVSADTKTAVENLQKISDKLASRGHGLEGEDFELLLKKGLRDLNITEAYKKLEEWGINGRQYNGDIIRLQQKGSSVTQQKKIEEDIIRELGGDENARKSYQLAYRMAVATFETSVWNYEMLGKAVLAEAMYFKDYRQDRAEKGRDRGPDITVDKIPGFGTSFLRSAQTADEESLSPLVSVGRGEITDMLVNQRIQIFEDGTTRFKRLHFEEMDFKKLSGEAYQTYIGLTLPRLLKTKMLLLRTDFKPDEATEDVLMDWVAVFKASDPENKLELKKWLITGLMDSGLKQGGRLGWGFDEVARFSRALVSKIGEKEGKQVSFLTKEEMHDIYNCVSEEDRIAKLISTLIGDKFGVRWRGLRGDVELALAGVLRTKR